MSNIENRINKIGKITKKIAKTITKPEFIIGELAFFYLLFQATKSNAQADKELKNPKNKVVARLTNDTPDYMGEIAQNMDYNFDRFEINGVTKAEFNDLSREEKEDYINKNLTNNKRARELLLSSLDKKHTELYILHLAKENSILVREEGLLEVVKYGLKSKTNQGIVELTKVILSPENYIPITKEELKAMENQFINAIDHSLTAYERFQPIEDFIYAGDFTSYSSSNEQIIRNENNSLLNNYIREAFGDYRLMDRTTINQIITELEFDKWINDELEISKKMSEGKKLYFANAGPDLTAYIFENGAYNQIGRFNDLTSKIDEIKLRKYNEKKKKTEERKDLLIVAKTPTEETQVNPYQIAEHPIAINNLYLVGENIKNSASQLFTKTDKLIRDNKKNPDFSRESKLLSNVILEDLRQFSDELKDGMVNLEVLGGYQKSAEQYEKDSESLKNDAGKLVINNFILKQYQEIIDKVNANVNLAIEQEAKEKAKINSIAGWMAVEIGTPWNDLESRIGDNQRKYSTELLRLKYPDQVFIISEKKSPGFDESEGVAIFRLRDVSLEGRVVNGKKNMPLSFVEEESRWHNDDIYDFGEKRKWSDIEKNLGNTVLSLKERYEGIPGLENTILLQDVSRRGERDEYLVLELYDGTIKTIQAISEEEFKQKYPTKEGRKLAEATETTIVTVDSDTVNALNKIIKENEKKHEKLIKEKETYYGGLLKGLESDVNYWKNQVETEVVKALGIGNYDGATFGANILFKKIQPETPKKWYQKINSGLGFEVNLSNKKNTENPGPVKLSNEKTREYQKESTDMRNLIVYPVISYKLKKDLDFLFMPALNIDFGSKSKETFQLYDKNGNPILDDTYYNKQDTKFHPAIKLGINKYFKKPKLHYIRGIQGDIGISNKQVMINGKALF